MASPSPTPTGSMRVLNNGLKYTLDDILYKKAQAPYTFTALFAFLEKNLASELLDFWVAGLDCRNMFEPDHPRSSLSMNKWDVAAAAGGTSPQDSSTRAQVDAALSKRHAEAQRLICQTYVFDDAPLQVNISEVQRKDVAGKCPQGDVAYPGLFDACMTECESLIKSNYFKDFVDLAKQHELANPGLHRHASPPPPPKPKPEMVKKNTVDKAEIARRVPKTPPPPLSTPEPPV
jgi:hypothetical protein